MLVAAVAMLFFSTSFNVVARSALAGLIKSFSVSLIVATSLLQMALMEKSGALKRVIIFIKTIASENKAVQIMLINIGFGTLMVSVGATPVSLLPPILIAMGYSTYVAIALPAIGYDSLCTYALLGAPIVVLVDMANGFLAKMAEAGAIAAGTQVTLSSVAHIFAYFVPVTSFMIGIAMLWITGKWQGVKKGLLPCLVTGFVIGLVAFATSHFNNLVCLTGVFCGIAVILAMLIYLKVTGKKIIDKSKLTPEELKYEKDYSLLKALSPWILLIVIILVLNVPPKLFTELYRNLLFPINGLTADGTPIKTRFLWNAYTWIFVSTILSVFILRPTKQQLKETCSVWLKRAPKPVFAAAIFFAIGEVMNMSGYDTSKPITGQDMKLNMVSILATASAHAFHAAYGAIVSFIGLFGGFITGSEASTIGMFGTYVMKTAAGLGLGVKCIIIMAAGLAFGAGLASVISPAKLQNAAASIDKIGEENKVIRTAFVFSIIFVAVTVVITLVLLKVFHGQ